MLCMYVSCGLDSIFTITERMLVSNEEGPSATDPTAIQSAGAASTSATGTSVTGNPSSDVITVTRHDSFDSVNSDFQWADKSRVITLRASSPEVRMFYSYDMYRLLIYIFDVLMLASFYRHDCCG
jgi:hypothetical protein